jgi:hypothetical protein
MFAPLAAVAVLYAVPFGAPPPNLAPQATITATSAATEPTGKYGALRALDGDPQTHWASEGGYKLPQELTLKWAQPVRLDIVVINSFAREQSNLYAFWKQVAVELSDGAKQTMDLPREQEDVTIVRFDRPHEIVSLVLRITQVYEHATYVGVDEIGVYLDPDHKIGLPRPVARALPPERLQTEGRPEHPIVYITKADVERARRNAEQTAWGKAAKQTLLDGAARWLEHDEAWWLQFLPPPGACYAYGFTGCPICGAGWGQWGGARCRWDRPRTVECTKGHVLPDAQHADDGGGYTGPDGRLHYFVGSWNAWVTEQWTTVALPALADAYALTGDEKYARRAAFFLDALASIYAESTAGSWDYPSSPPSGRFARPWFQVARTLVVFVEAYDLVYSSAAFDQPSLRPQIEARFPAGPTPQSQRVKTPDAHGQSKPGMTRRENVDTNLMRDAAYYCYEHTFSGALHNGHADYMRGALAVGALLGIPEYVRNAVDSPYSIYAMLANNCDRDGRYYETSLGYALHARDLYLTFVEPLRNWRDRDHPDGINLLADARMRSFYLLPDLAVNLCGHAPNFGDWGPDDRYEAAPGHPFSATDYRFAEHLYAGSPTAERERFARILRFLGEGDVERLRASSQLGRWLLYHADPVPPGEATLPADLERKVFGSWFLGQKGLALLRDGREQDAQGALLRFGPSLNHGDLDDLGLIYYAKGWQLCHEIGYGLASTHTQVGWGSQTASHTLVTVNEQSQGGAGSGSGGSLHLFARLPGLKLVEAASPLSYAAQKVTQYRRTVALVGEGRDQYLVDFFRVAGGRQHDYLVGSQGQDFEVNGVSLGAEEAGSLAGAENAWGQKIGLDGDVIGCPNKPYWNPPPGNGYSFFYGVRRAQTAQPWSVTWALGGPNDARFCVHVLPEGDSEAIVAKAPGLYPANRNTSYLLSRRRGENLRSAFVSVMEPYAVSLPGDALDAKSLLKLMTAHSQEVRLLSEYGVVLHKGQQAGDQMTFRVEVKAAGPHEIAALMLQAPSYGSVRLIVDGQPLGQPFRGTADTVRGPQLVVFGRRDLTAGPHDLRFEMTAEESQYFIGVGSLILRPAGAETLQPLKPRPVLSAVELLLVKGPSDTLVPLGVHVRRGDVDEILASADLASKGDSVVTPAGELKWDGAVVYLKLKQGKPVVVATHGAGAVTLGQAKLIAGPPAHIGKVVAVNYEEHWVEVQTESPLPATGLEGEPAIFSSPRYTRTTAYRIAKISPAARGRAAPRVRIEFGDQAMRLGQGRVHQIPDEHTILTDIPHEYAQSVIGGTNDGFFNGKLLQGEGGAKTFLRAVEFDTPMKLRVESSAGFQEGEVLHYCDLAVGDIVTIPTSTWQAFPR